jgi:hypothetical protein
MIFGREQVIEMLWRFEVKGLIINDDDDEG